MTVPGFFEQAALAALVAVGAALLVDVAAPMVGTMSALAAAIPAAGFVALAWWSLRALPNGRLGLLALWGAVTATCIVLTAPLVLAAFGQIAVVSLAHGWAARRSAVGRLGELLLGVAATAAAVLAFTRTGSVALALWSALIVRALSALVPEAPDGDIDPDTHAPFERARARAEAALDALAR